jgi:uncharacterized RDD family membrane protein YckC
MDEDGIAADRPRYAGFGRRVGALGVDILISNLLLLPIVIWGGSRFKYFPLYSLGPIAMWSLFYNVYLVRRFGGTPGKLVMRVEIRNLDGTSVGYRAALLRFLPEFLLGLLASISLAMPLFEVTDPGFQSLGLNERNQLLRQLASPWYETVEVFEQVWVWSEFIVMLTNRKRRALHDFIAGTVVVIRERQEGTASVIGG